MGGSALIGLVAPPASRFSTRAGSPRSSLEVPADAAPGDAASADAAPGDAAPGDAASADGERGLGRGGGGGGVPRGPAGSKARITQAGGLTTLLGGFGGP